MRRDFPCRKLRGALAAIGLLALGASLGPVLAPSAGAQTLRPAAGSVRGAVSGSPLLADAVAGLPRRERAAVRPAADDEQFWAYDFADHAYYLTHATRVHASAVLNLYVESGQHVAPADLARLAALFEDQVYPRLRNRFGHEPEPGIDGERAITVLLLDIRDAFAAGVPPQTLYSGYFDPTNQVLQADLDAAPTTTARRSNEREMLYLDVAPSDPASPAFRQTLAHEFTHLITWNYDPDEERWLSEGLSELGVHVAGLGHPLEHLEAFLREPEGSLDRFDDSSRDYGKVYLFLLYLFEQAENAAASGDAAAGLWPKTLVQQPDAGIASLQSSWPVARPLAELFRDYVVAVQLDDPSLADGRYGFRSLDLGLPADGRQAVRGMAAHSRAVYPLHDEPVTLAPWSIRADRFVGGRGDVDIIVSSPRATCVAAVGLATLGRSAPGAGDVRPGCTSAEQPVLDWAFPDFRTRGATPAILALSANASDEPLTLALSALPPLGSLRWAPAVYLPIAVR